MLIYWAPLRMYRKAIKKVERPFYRHKSTFLLSARNQNLLKHKDCMKWWYSLQDSENLNFPALFSSAVVWQKCGKVQILKCKKVRENSNSQNVKTGRKIQVEIPQMSKNAGNSKNVKKCGKIQILQILYRVSPFHTFFVL